MDFETVTQTKPSIALNHFPEYAPDYSMLKLVRATQTNANHFILYIPSIADSQAQ
jgi:hypothetical protein